MASILDPFSESERFLLQHAFKVLHQTNFFERYAEIKSLEMVNVFDSLQAADKLAHLEALAGIRRTLLFLGAESGRIASSIESDSELTETGDSSNVYLEEPLFPNLGPE